MGSIREMDQAVIQLASELQANAPFRNWQRQRLTAAYTPQAGVGAHEYAYWLQDGTVNRSDSPNAAARVRIRELTATLWRLSQESGQAPWFKMNLDLDAGGKYSIDFEYRDNYQEGDIMKSLD